VLPLGVKRNEGTPGLVFGKWDALVPGKYNEEELQKISDLYWQKQNYTPRAQQRYFDFRELEHVYQMLQMFFDLDDAATIAELESSLPELMATLEYYTE
jgi:hypothetical protein